MNETNKHCAIINLELECHELLPTGECSGHIIPRSKLKEYNIVPKKLYRLNAENLNTLLLKLKEILDQFK